MVLKAERSKEINMDLKKLRKKLYKMKVDLKHNKKMAAFSAIHPNCNEESEEWRQRVTKNEEFLDSLITQIQELDEIDRRENFEVLNALAVVKDVKRRVADAKGKLGLIQNLIEVYSRTPRQTQTITPSSIIANLQENDEDGC